MGLSSFPTTVSEGVLPILIVNTALSFAIIKDILRSLLQIMGFNMASTESDLIDSSWPSYSAEENPAVSAGHPEVQIIAEEIRHSLPIKKFKADKSEKGHTDCAVCLSRFEEEDETRELPCCHFFHRPCLDKWLDHQQTTCPLCRSNLISEEAANKIRLREQELTDEWIFWCSSFQEGTYLS
eukprot:TRINITY_DN35456_c0_g1_i1.p1 TRINITY_DN35456_c0_g1~~TRINITY_DN35456_c0_g1_i1.p1  ORF type:complete len:182 (-),score=30.35 TRINITY_DN35456_c0_g1_i1:402-947(-)